MIPILEDCILGTDLDGRQHDLLNVGALVPVPANLATSDHPGLSDPRPPVPGSVTNESVAIDAGIVQSKLSLDGQIPTAWLGTSPGTAAQGDLAEYLANKNVPGGYAGLDATGKILPANLPAAVGIGTVTSVGLAMPPQFSVGPPVTGAGSLSAAWSAVPDLAWFGNMSGAPAPPQFYNAPFPPTLIPALDASAVTSGVFDPARLPVAVGVGLDHAPGAVPSPGDGGGPGDLPTDYLARDMTFKNLPTPTDPAYQPALPNPTLTRASTGENPVPVSVALLDVGGNPVDDSHTVFLYSIISATTGFKEFPPERFVRVAVGTVIYAYVAHAGFNNSAIVNLTA